MSDLNEKLQNFLKEIKENISNEKDADFASEKMLEITAEYLKTIENFNSRLEELENAQTSIENKVDKIQASVDGIENDIYEDEYDFEIICPYCNTQFFADVTSKSDIKCPECNNTIELDWNDGEEEFSCSGSCSSCGSNCHGDWLEEYGEIESFDEEKNEEEE